MIINRENYEVFLLDLMEGNLSEDQEIILMHFLEENPDLAVDENLTDLKLPDISKSKKTEISFPMKEELKKGGMNSEINEVNYEQFCIARLEGDLSGEAESRLDRYLSENPGPGKSAEAFRYLNLKADKSVVFPDKNALKKGNSTIFEPKDYFKRSYFYKAVSIAASIAIIITVFNQISYNFITDPLINHDKRNANLFDDQSPILEHDVIPEPGISPERSLVESSDADLYGRESRESGKPEIRIPLPAVVEESTPDNSQQLASREPVLLPVKNISPGEVKIIPTNFSPEIVKPEHTAVVHMEQSTPERSGAGMIINGILAFATRNVEKNEDAGGLNIWDIADAGFKGINSLTGADLRLEREFNQEGELVSMAFSSRVLEFRRTSSARDN